MLILERHWSRLKNQLSGTSYPFKGAIDAALECKKNGETKTILFNLCGHGHFDMKAYGDYFEGNLAEDKFDKGSMDKALEDLPKIA